MPTEPSWQDWLERLYNLRRDSPGSHERPHKPVLLLAIMDLLDRGIISENSVRLDDYLVKAFKRYFEVVRQHDDRPSIQNPFYHLCGDGFWELASKPGEPPLYQHGKASGTPSMKVLRETRGRFDDAFWRLLENPDSRRQVREAIISRYFPEHRDQIASVSRQRSGSSADQMHLHDQLLPARDRAFRRIILEIYDYRCSACGIRVRLTDDLSLVEAAHIIPFKISHNDKPTNGLALCPNHHWAMDRHLIAPCPDRKHLAGIWRVRPDLDDRIEGQRDLVELSNRPVIGPNERIFYPSIEGLRWREEHLTDPYQDGA